MGSDYIPPREGNQFYWMTQFNTYAQTGGMARGATAADLAELQTALDAFGGARVAAEQAQAAAKAAFADKQAKRVHALRLARRLAQLFQNHPAMTDAERAQAGLTVPDRTPTPGGGIDLDTIPPPIVLLDYSRRSQITIHWGPNPGSERYNGKPAGVMGVEIEVARGVANGSPIDPAAWKLLDRDTESPTVAVFHEPASLTLAFRARWIGKNLKTGPVGDVVTCALTV